MLQSKLRLLAASLFLAAPLLVLAADADVLPPKAYTIPSKGISKDIRAAVESAERTEAMKAHDGYRRPAEILALAGLRPGQRVVELGSYDRYYSTMLSEVVGKKGNLHMYDLPYVGEQIGESTKTFAEARPNTTYTVVDFNKIELPRGVDVVISYLSFHDMLLTGVLMEQFHTALFKALKPGGIYLVVDHLAEHGVGTDAVGPLRRVDPETIRPYAGSAGFELYEDSRLLQNTQDDHKSPVMSEAAADMSDKLVYKFRKPVVY